MRLRELEYVKAKLHWLEQKRLWPNGSRYLWTDAFGVVSLVSLYEETHDENHLLRAEWVVSEVQRVLGRSKGIRIGEDPDMDGQYFHYLAMWMFALKSLGDHKPEYKQRAIELVQDVHEHFFVEERGMWWKMKEDLSGPYAGSETTINDVFTAYVVYRLIDGHDLSDEISDVKAVIDTWYDKVEITQDLPCGMLLWCSHIFPHERWSRFQRTSCLNTLRQLWVSNNGSGFFCRDVSHPYIKFASANFAISLGLQAVEKDTEKVEKLNTFFEEAAADGLDMDVSSHIMACVSHFPGKFIVDNKHTSVSISPCARLASVSVTSPLASSLSNGSRLHKTNGFRHHDSDAMHPA
eukprot:GILJ01009476.1.p1 GENE.GILJ01009476.1~~GILJ01009476.1.p1  ORF type:complete len:385 (+),score=39.27 GILJ01009476.1:107-1156(+)